MDSIFIEIHRILNTTCGVSLFADTTSTALTHGELEVLYRSDSCHADLHCKTYRERADNMHIIAHGYAGPISLEYMKNPFRFDDALNLVNLSLEKRQGFRGHIAPYGLRTSGSLYRGFHAV